MSRRVTVMKVGEPDAAANYTSELIPDYDGEFIDWGVHSAPVKNAQETCAIVEKPDGTVELVRVNMLQFKQPQEIPVLDLVWGRP